ncbi:MAG: hypothetical protein HC941_30285 [Microcoleus sp. SU_5_3]|nr:hypothetical protein [Microcoleus sp. SU_5_3]
MAGVYQDVKDRLHGKHYKISDNGLNRTVFVGAPVRTGELEGKLVAVKNGKVYASTTSFQQAESRSASDVVLLTEKEFYGKWHNRDVSNYDFFKTIENLAKIECLEYLNRLPTDDSIWEDCFDFPGLDSLS